MNSGRTVFAQVMECLPLPEFHACVAFVGSAARYAACPNGDHQREEGWCSGRRGGRLSRLK